jgi:hypothetical protein
MVINLIVDGVFTYGFEYYLQKLGMFSLVRMKKIQLMYAFMVDALLLYCFQLFKEKILIKKA